MPVKMIDAKDESDAIAKMAKRLRKMLDTDIYNYAFMFSVYDDSAGEENFNAQD
jgi:hypothetical protein